MHTLRAIWRKSVHLFYFRIQSGTWGGGHTQFDNPPTSALSSLITLLSFFFLVSRQWNRHLKSPFFTIVLSDFLSLLTFRISEHTDTLPQSDFAFWWTSFSKQLHSSTSSKYSFIALSLFKVFQKHRLLWNSVQFISSQGKFIPTLVRWNYGKSILLSNRRTHLGRTEPILPQPFC